MIEQKKDLVILQPLEGNDPSELTPSQAFIQPHVETIYIFWWAVWFLVLAVVIVTYIIKPIVRTKFKHLKRP